MPLNGARPGQGRRLVLFPLLLLSAPSRHHIHAFRQAVSDGLSSPTSPAAARRGPLSPKPQPPPSLSVARRRYRDGPSSPPATSGRSAKRTQLPAWPQARDADPKGVPPDYPLAVARILATILSVFLTWNAHASRRCGPVLASAAVTLVATLVAPGLGQAAMCGTFAGMSCHPGLVATWQSALYLGAVTSVLFEALVHYRDALLGAGGRLGAVAFLAVNAAAAIGGVPVSSSPVPAAPLGLLAGCGAVGSAATIALREASDDRAAADPVRASAVVGLVASLLVGVVPGLTDAAASAVYAGSFVGMSLPSRLMRGIAPGGGGGGAPAPHTSSATLLASFALVGAVGGLLNGFTLRRGWWAAPGGWGGKAGFCSLVAVLAYGALARVVRGSRER